MIDIIIPAYNSHNTIERTLCSIAYQENIQDLKIYIVNDASEKDYSNEVKFFSNFMNIQELTLTENSGTGVARQYGIDHSSSEYIIFIDSDDMFSNPKAIETLYNNITENDYDVVISSIFEQEEDGNFLEHMNDRIWLHGKIYKRKFLEENQIRFNNTRSNEDNGFNQSIFLSDSKIKVIDEFTYIYTFNQFSITKINNRRFRYTGLARIYLQYNLGTK